MKSLIKPDLPPRAPRKTISEFERDVDKVTGTTRELAAALPAFLRALSTFLGDSAVEMHLYEEEDQEFVLRGSTQRRHGNGEAPRFLADGTIPGLAVTEHRIVSLSEDPAARAGRLRAEEHVFPLETGGRALGAVTVTQIAAERLSPVRLDRARRGILRIAEALSKARSEEALARRLSRLSAINDFGSSLVTTLTLEEVPALATSMTSFIIGAEGCILRLRDEKTTESALRDAHGLRDAASSREILKLEELASQQVLLSGKVLFVRDVSAHERYHHYNTRVKTFICCPITREGKTIGTITLFNKDPENPLTPARFSQEDQDVLLRLVRYIEKAIGNATLFARSRELAQRDELTGLPDRAYFQGRLLTEISRAQRFHLRVTLVTCEVQPFPAREDAPEDAAANQTLRQVAQAISGAVRRYDTVARLSERTFGIILPQVQNDAGSPIARIQAAIDQEVDRQRRSGSARELQARLFHATFPDDVITGEQMLTNLERQGRS